MHCVVCSILIVIEQSFRSYSSFQGRVCMQTLISGKWQMFSKLQLENCRFSVPKLNILTEIEVSIENGIINMAGALTCLLKCPVGVSWTLSTFSAGFWIIPSERFALETWGLFYLSHTHDHTMETEMILSEKT